MPFLVGCPAALCLFSNAMPCLPACLPTACSQTPITMVMDSNPLKL